MNAAHSHACVLVAYAAFLAVTVAGVVVLVVTTIDVDGVFAAAVVVVADCIVFFVKTIESIAGVVAASVEVVIETVVAFLAVAAVAVVVVTAAAVAVVGLTVATTATVDRLAVYVADSGIESAHVELSFAVVFVAGGPAAAEQEAVVISLVPWEYLEFLDHYYFQSRYLCWHWHYSKQWIY
jgi:hypothetical protein